MAQRFTKAFEEEAVRLVRTSGRTRREIADDLGVGVSTLSTHPVSTAAWDYRLG